MIGFGSTVDPYNSYTTLTSYTENFISCSNYFWLEIYSKKDLK